MTDLRYLKNYVAGTVVKATHFTPYLAGFPTDGVGTTGIVLSNGRRRRFQTPTQVDVGEQVVLGSYEGTRLIRPRYIYVHPSARFSIHSFAPDESLLNKIATAISTISIIATTIGIILLAANLASPTFVITTSLIFSVSAVVSATTSGPSPVGPDYEHPEDHVSMDGVQRELKTIANQVFGESPE